MAQTDAERQRAYRVRRRLAGKGASTNRPTKSRAGWVYVAESQGFCKIGLCTNGDVVGRLKAMQVGNPSPISLVASIRYENAEKVEHELHERYSVDRVRGEWFKVEDKTELLLTMAKLTAQHMESS